MNMLKPIICYYRRKNNNNSLFTYLDTSVLYSMCIIVFVSVLMIIFPTQSKLILNKLRIAFNHLGLFYTTLGVLVFFSSIVLAFSKYGKIKIGGEKAVPSYNPFLFGIMVFTITMSSDLFFWSMIEWSYYYSDPFINGLGMPDKWSSTYPLFHWGCIPWSFYILPAICFAYMIYSNKIKKFKISDVCRPLIGKYSDRWIGKLIDILSLFALFVGVSTTFSIITPLLSSSLSEILSCSINKYTSLLFLVFTSLCYTLLVWSKSQKRNLFSIVCTSSLIILIMIVLFSGPTQYILKTGIDAVSNLISNFHRIIFYSMSNEEIPNLFTKKWTIFYWSYWLVWSVGVPFFIGRMMKGYTIRQAITIGYLAGIMGTFVCFIVFGNFGLYLQTSGVLNISFLLNQGVNPSEIIIKIISHLPFAKIAFMLIVLNIILFYITTFDAVVSTVSSYSSREIGSYGKPVVGIHLLYSIFLIILPSSLIVIESLLENLQTMTIIAALPSGIILILIFVSFFIQIKQNTSSSYEIFTIC